MVLDVYIGFADNDSFNWDSGGNIPKRQSPFFPAGHKVFDKVLKMVKSDKYDGKELGWEAWGVKLTKQQIFDFIEPFIKKNPYPWLDTQNIWHDVIKFVKKLEDDKNYILVACNSFSELTD